MRFYFPDSQDQIDPSFDFQTEDRSPFRIRQRDDLYPHEVLSPVPYTGMLVSKTMVDGVDGGAGRYSAQQRQRLYRVGVREFFRLDDVDGPRLDTMGDCGAFTYFREEVPPYTPDDVIDFYDGCGFDAGLSVDHVILGFEEHAPPSADLLPPEWPARQALTLELAAEFLSRHAARRSNFEPIGVAQGWSPGSYAHSVVELQRIGYRRIALGGLVPLKTHEILAALAAIAGVRDPETELHLLGITRCEHVGTFRDFGVTSFDSTSAFRQAFKDDRDNYHTPTGAWIALRVPQVEGNQKLMRRIRAGEIDQALARRLEKTALATLDAFDKGTANVEDAVAALRDYEQLHDGQRDRSPLYREVLAAAPWKLCDCAVCQDAGIHAVLFRGSERNKRRGFHNLHVFAQRLAREVGLADDRAAYAA
jgi:hypothetical protein